MCTWHDDIDVSSGDNNCSWINNHSHINFVEFGRSYATTCIGLVSLSYSNVLYCVSIATMVIIAIFGRQYIEPLKAQLHGSNFGAKTFEKC